MNVKKPVSRFFLAFVMMILSGLYGKAQSNPNTPEPSPSQEKQASASRAANASTHEMQSKIDRLETLLEQQQRILVEVQKRLVELEGKPRTASTNEPANPVSPINAGVFGLPTAGTIPTAVLKESSSKPASSVAQNPTKAPDKSPLLAGWDKAHAVLRSADGRFETNIAGYAQLDFHGYASGNHPANTFLIRRARFILDGKLEKYFDYRIEGDFSDTNNTILRDFFIRIHRIDQLQLSFGQFRQPFSQEEMRQDNTQDFVERSLVNNLAPSRSPGIMASGTFRKGAFEYQLGAYNGKGLLANNNNGTPDTALRLRFAPWKNGNTFLTKGLYFGGAYSQGRNFNGTSVRGLMESRSFTFYTPETVNGRLYRANGELTWLLGPAALRAEYDQTNQARANLGVGGTNLPGIVAKGYMSQFTYLLTGEDKPESTATIPKRDLFDSENGKRGYGAFELKFRYSNLQIANGTAKSNRAESIYFGANWYLNRFVRYLLDFGYERFKDPVRSPKPGDRNYLVVLSRMQIAF